MLQLGTQSIQVSITAALDLSSFGSGAADASDLFVLGPAPAGNTAAPAAPGGGSAFEAGPPYERLPLDAAEALQGPLPTWHATGGSQRRLTALPLPAGALQALQSAADRIVDAIAASAAPSAALAPAAAVASKQEAPAGRGVSQNAINTAALLAPSQTPRQVELAAAAAVVESVAELREADEAARMAAEWLSLLAKGPVGKAAAQAALAGLAITVIVCSSPRCGDSRPA